MMRILRFFKKLVQNNTGISSKNFFLVCVTIIGFFLLAVPSVILLIEGICNKTIQTDLNGLAAYIGAVATVFVSAGITKVWSEKFEYKNNSNSSNNSNSENLDNNQQ